MKKIIIAATVIAMMSQSAYAAVTFNENADTKVMTVSGTLEGTELTNLVSLDIENAQGDNVYTNFITADGGNFTFDFKLADDAPTGKYTLILDAHGLSTPEKILIDYVSVSETNAIITALNGAADNTAMKTVLDTHRVAFNISERWYSLLSDDDKTVIADALLAGRGVGYQNSDIPDIIEAVRVSLAPLAFMASETEADIETALSQFEDLYDILSNTALSAKYEAFTPENAAYARKLMAENKDSVQDMYTLYDSSVLLAEISAASQPLDILNIIEGNRNLITFDLSTFDISNKTTTAQYLYGKTYEKMSDLQVQISNAYAAQSTVIIPSGGSSGGSGKGSSSIVNIPAPKEPDTVTVENADIFTDLENAEWAKTAVNYLANNKIISGVGDKKFDPFGDVTREQFAVMLAKAFELTNNGAEAEFEDVSKDHWAYNAIASLYKAGVVNGIDDAHFGIGNKIKRQDIAVMVKNAMEKCGYDLSGTKEISLTDMSALPGYAAGSVEAMVRAGIINGFEDNTFRGSETATRAQAAQIIYTVLQRKDV